MGRVGERAGEKHGYERYIDWLPLSRPQSGTWLAPQACALTGNQTCDPLVRKLALNPLSHTSQGLDRLLKQKIAVAS